VKISVVVACIRCQDGVERCHLVVCVLLISQGGCQIRFFGV